MENKEFNWEEVVDFFSKKYILTRPSFTGSSVEIDGNKLNVTLGNRGKFLLIQKNVDKTVSDFIFNTTGKKISKSKLHYTLVKKLKYKYLKTTLKN